MTPKEAQLAFNEFAKTIGADCRVVVFLNDNYPGRSPLQISLYKTWPRGDHVVRFESETFEEGFSELQIKWTEFHAKEGETVIKTLALEIIRVTDLHGVCKEADLRMLAGITANDVIEFSEAACAMADEMAGKGPFTIEKGAKGNAP